MRWNLGSSAWPGGRRRRGPRVAHSNPPRPSETEKLMFVRLRGTPSSASMRSKFG